VSAANGSRPDTDLSIARAAAAEHCANLIVGAFEICERRGVALSQIQKIALIEAALLEFDGFEAQLTSLSRVARLLRGIGADRRTR
jgi:hypothetical protein